ACTGSERPEATMTVLRRCAGHTRTCETSFRYLSARGGDMMDSEQRPPKSRKRFGTVWGELQYVCRKIHHWLYVRKDRTSARRYLRRLRRVLGDLPENDMAILRSEGMALLHELEGQKTGAIQHREREIQLIEMLHQDVEKSMQAGDYDESTGAWALANW